MIVEYAPGAKLDVGAGVACRAAGVSRAPLAAARDALVGRLVSFLACHSGKDGRGGGQWIAAALDLDIERAGLIEPRELPQGSFVYIIGPEDGSAVKIGTTTDLHQRLVTIQSAHPGPLVLFALLDGDFELERRLHQTFAPTRIHGEWFRADDAILAYLARLGREQPVRLLRPGGLIRLADNPPDLQRALTLTHDHAMRRRDRPGRRPSSAVAEPASPVDRRPPRTLTSPPIAPEAVDSVVLAVLEKRPGVSPTIVAHILCGSNGPATVAAGADLPEYGRFSDYGPYPVVYGMVRERVDACLSLKASRA